jgi:hypothetical protein
MTAPCRQDDRPRHAFDAAVERGHVVGQRRRKWSKAMSATNDAAAFLGRLLLSVIFVLSGFQKLTEFSGTVAFIGSEGLPLPFVTAIVAVVVECVGGILLIVGYQTRLTGQCWYVEELGVGAVGRRPVIVAANHRRADQGLIRIQIGCGRGASRASSRQAHPLRAAFTRSGLSGKAVMRAPVAA